MDRKIFVSLHDLHSDALIISFFEKFMLNSCNWCKYLHWHEILWFLIPWPINRNNMMTNQKRFFAFVVNCLKIYFLSFTQFCALWTNHELSEFGEKILSSVIHSFCISNDCCRVHSSFSLLFISQRKQIKKLINAYWNLRWPTTRIKYYQPI